MQQYNKTIQKIINFDGVTKQNMKNIIDIDKKFLIIHN